jgi:HEAT repeat protein
MADSASALASLAEALDDPSRMVRLEACRAVTSIRYRQLRDNTGVERLLRLLETEEDPFVAQAAYWALGTYGGPRIAEARARFRFSDWGQEVWRIVTRRD